MIEFNGIEVEVDDNITLDISGLEIKKIYDWSKISAKNYWTKVTEKYPKEYERVLIYNDFMEEISIDYIVEFLDEKIWACSRESDFKNINYWMPLPKLPKSEE